MKNENQNQNRGGSSQGGGNQWNPNQVTEFLEPRALRHNQLTEEKNSQSMYYRAEDVHEVLDNLGIPRDSFKNLSGNRTQNQNQRQPTI